MMTTGDFRRVVDSLQVPVALADPRGTLTFANAALAQMAGVDASELVGRSLAELFRGPAQRRVAQGVSRVAEGKAAQAFVDAELATADLSERWVHAVLQPVADEAGGISAVAAVVQDIGAQRDLEGALNLLTARLIALAEHSPVAMLVETGAGDVEILNAPFCALLGLQSAPESLSGLAVKDVLARSERIEPRAVQQAVANPDEPSTLSVTGERGLVQVERQPILVEGEPDGALWIAREAAAAGAATAKAGVEIGLIERIGVELAVALEGLSAVSILAEQIHLDAAIVERFHGIHASTETALTAIGDLVDFSRVSGGIVLQRRQFGLREALARLVERLVTNAEEHGCRLRVKVEQDVADALEGDVERLQLVLRNLVDNAFSLLPGAEILLQITPEFATASAIQLSFSVNAAGADAARASARTSAESGMGVAVARFMVKAMGGTLAIAARGTQEPLYSFTVEFPLCAPPPGPRRATYVSLVGLTVLVVSDDPQQRLEITNLLRGWRMVPLEADNAPMALALLERLEQEGSPVPLVILSNRLPVQDGFLLSFRIKHSPRLRTTLVMMLAREGKPGDAIACRENGIAAYMRYPINDRQLNEAIVAVTGASIDADETPTLVTRHSLREQRKGATVLLVDASRDSQILAAHILGRMDCAVVVAQDLAEALAALDQDLYDVVIVDTALAGLGGADAPKLLRSRMQRAQASVRLIATAVDPSTRFDAEKRAAGFDATIAKPFRREALLGLVRVRATAETP
jgi:PAS domain S-box-containing protein